MNLQEEYLQAIHFLNLCSHAFYQKEMPFIVKKSSYEKELAESIDNQVILKETRYQDLAYKSLAIEVKKGQGAFWIPEVRMAELMLQKNLQHHWTLFIRFQKNKKLITSIAMIPTSVLLADMQITQEWAEKIIARDQEMKIRQRTIHCQQSYSWTALIALPGLLKLDLK